MNIGKLDWKGSLGVKFKFSAELCLKLTTQKMKFSIKKDLVTFTEVIVNRKLHFLCSGYGWKVTITFVRLLSQDGFKKDYPEIKFQKLTS